MEIESEKNNYCKIYNKQKALNNNLKKKIDEIKEDFNDYKKNLVLNLMVDFALLLLYTELPFWGIIFTTTRTSIF